MNTEQKHKTMIKRLENLSPIDLQDLKTVGHHRDTRIVRDRAYLEEAYTEYPEPDRIIEWYWKNNILGASYERYKAQSQRWMKDQDKFILIMEKVQSRKRYGTLRGYTTVKNTYRKHKLSEFLIMCFLRCLGNNDLALWESESNPPKFKIGQMVKLRSSVGVDSVLKKHEYGQRGYWYGCGRKDLKEAKGKTFMVVEIDPELDGQCYAKMYSYHKTQGGCRYYKLLPIGEAKTYYVVEKFLKKFRVKK